VEKPSNAKEKTYGRQPVNTPYCYQEWGYNAVRHSGDIRFNVEKPSNAKEKTYGRQPVNTPYYYQESGYNTVRRLTRLCT
jgi:hypothetical protein